MKGTTISDARRLLFENIREVDIAKYPNQESERVKINQLIQSTIDHGEANSALIIGPRGSGKTTLINDVLDEVTTKRNFSENAILVKLHGLVHTNDNLALRSITRQLNLVNVVEGKVFGSFAENLSFLLASLKCGQKDISKSVIFILDEFDFFCTHHNQTLLYNLFDISQSAQTPVCVLGITCRLDVIELLEKRVKSRFSHRQIFIFPDTASSQDEMINTLLKNIANVLSLQVSKKSSKQVSLAYRSDWNKHIQNLVKDRQFKIIIQRFLDIDVGKNCLKNILISIISQLQEDDDIVTIAQFEQQLEKFEKDATVIVLQDLNVLELCLIIAMKHHSEIYNNQPMNFEMVLSRYIKFTNANSSTQAVPRAVVMKAFEHLLNLELISFVSSTGGKLQKEYQLFRLAVTPQQIMQSVKSYSSLPTEVVQWASSSLI